jgi:hypothetical protein
MHIAPAPVSELALERYETRWQVAECLGLLSALARLGKVPGAAMKKPRGLDLGAFVRRG